MLLVARAEPYGDGRESQTRYAATRATMFQIAAAGNLTAIVFAGTLDRFSGFLTGSTVWTRNTRTGIIRSGCR
jgi:hypothetical protein